MPDRNKTQIRPGGQHRRTEGAGPSLSRFKDRLAHRAKWFMAVLLFAIVVGTVAFFAGTPFANVNQTSSATTAADDTVATVGDTKITRSELENIVAAQKRQLDQYGIPDGLADQPGLYARVIRGLVQRQVEMDAAKKSGIQVSDDEYQKELDKQVDQVVSQEESSYQSPAAFAAFLKSENKTPEDFHNDMRNQIIDQNAQKGQDIKQLITDDLQVQDFKKQYEEGLTLPRFVRYSEIVVSSNPPPKPPTTPAPSPADKAKADAADKAKADAAAKTQADALLKQLQGGADFAALAKKSSSGYSKDKGGDMGWVNPTAPQTQDYLKGLATAKIGQLLGPFKSFDGYHILKVVAETTRLPKDAKPDTEGALMSAADDLYQKYVDGLVKKAKVTYVDPMIQGVIAQTPDSPGGKSDLVAALAAYQRALQRKSILPDEQGWVSFAAGQILMGQNNAAAALADFQITVKSDPYSPDAWMAHGDAEKKLGKTDLAKTDYKKALDLGKSNSAVLQQLGAKFMEMKDSADAATARQSLQQAGAQGGAGGMGGMFPGMMQPQAPAPVQSTPAPGPGKTVGSGTIHIGGPAGAPHVIKVTPGKVSKP